MPAYGTRTLYHDIVDLSSRRHRCDNTSKKDQGSAIISREVEPWTELPFGEGDVVGFFGADINGKDGTLVLGLVWVERKSEEDERYEDDKEDDENHEEMGVDVGGVGLAN